jgi:hypothetical protein
MALEAMSFFARRSLGTCKEGGEGRCQWWQASPQFSLRAEAISLDGATPLPSPDRVGADSGAICLGDIFAWAFVQIECVLHDDYQVGES